LTLVPTTSHWGAYSVQVEDGRVTAVVPHAADPDPSPLLGNVADSLRHPTRIARPAIRRGWLERGAGPDHGRGEEPFVEVSWEEALDRLAAELARVRERHGNEAIFGGSYGWASAGRFHHAQSQLHRFLNLIGGYTGSRNTYSTGTSEVLLPHILGGDEQVFRGASTWPTIVEHTELLVAFGGVPSKNVFVTPGGLTRHRSRHFLGEAVARGLEIALVSPLRADLPDEVPAAWYAVRPGSDVALMLGLCHTLVTEGLVDTDFLHRCCVGYEPFKAYLQGRADGEPKSAEWAEVRCEVPAASIRELARRMATRRTLVTVTWSLQRTDHGEQPVWAAIALAALLGQIGLPGGGFGHGYGSMGDIGDNGPRLRPPTFGQGRNPVHTFIPVARITDLLLHPGELFEYDGETHVYPDIRLVYWAGGNPFHHHQDLFRLRDALGRPDTVVVHDPYWTPMARHADVVLPATVSLERDDLGGGRRDSHLIAMRAAVPPYGEARDDHAILAGLAERLGVGERFTEGRTVADWLEHLYEDWRRGLERRGLDVPPFERFWAEGGVRIPSPDQDGTLLGAFRSDPSGRRLATPSGLIELCSETIGSFGYAECPAHPTWMPPRQWSDAPSFPLHLIANQPSTRLHSQLDVGAVSRASKIQGREPLRLHPDDAARRGIADGDVVRVTSPVGACLAGARVTADVRPGVVQLATGAWFDPQHDPELGWMCVHGNPNVVIGDHPSSRLSQGCAGQHAMVEVERFDGPVPPLAVHAPPAFSPFDFTPSRPGPMP
jgi:biotin/methionine sulfoxide reductase